MDALKNINPSGIAAIPSAYKLEEVTITNKDSVAINLASVVAEIEITESIYSPTMICKISVLDESNILETLPIYGLETLHVRISRIQGGDAEERGVQGSFQEIDRVFYVTEYPLFGRIRRERAQVWSMVGVSHHAWKNQLMRISRGYSGTITNEIVKIGKDAFGLTTNILGGAESKGQGIINIQTPLQAIDWFRRRLYEPDGTPFYYFESLQSKPTEISLESHSAIASKPPHSRYVDSRDFNVPAGTLEDYEARKERMVNVSSTLKLSKLSPARTGAFASENQFLDLATKTFTKKYYDYSMFPLDSTLHGTSILKSPPPFEFQGDIENRAGAPTPIPNEENVETEYFSHMEHLSLNSEAYLDSSLQNYMQWSHTHVDILNAFPGVFDTLMHEIVVHGDFELNAGKTVTLKFPKAADPNQTGKDKLYDESLSGKYIVLSAIHRFKDQEYYTDIRVKRDSFSP